MRSLVSAAVLALTLFAGCKSEEPVSGKLEDSVELRALVTAIDLPQRLLTLKGDDGVEVVVEASEAVRNLAQIEVGDQVVVSYTAAVSWLVRSAGEGAPGVAAGATLERAAPGEKPGGRAGGTVTLTASITAIDKARGTVTLTGPAGNSLTLKPREPKNLEKVKVGDLVDITYSEVFAVAVRPAEPNK